MNFNSFEFQSPLFFKLEENSFRRDRLILGGYDKNREKILRIRFSSLKFASMILQFEGLAIHRVDTNEEKLFCKKYSTKLSDFNLYLITIPDKNLWVGAKKLEIFV